MSIEKEIQLFEEWCDIFGLPTDEVDGEYADPRTTIAFLAWHEVVNRQGYKLVPVDLIERCISHIGIASCHPANSLHDDQQMESDIDALEKAMIGACDEH